MKLQMIKDSSGKDAGVFIPISDWLTIKTNYPDIEDTCPEIPQWEKDLIDQRLEAISENPGRIMPGGGLLDELKKPL